MAENLNDQNINDALNSFLDDQEPKQTKPDNSQRVLNERDGLIERFDPIYVNKDGKQLLRERY